MDGVRDRLPDVVLGAGTVGERPADGDEHAVDDFGVGKPAGAGAFPDVAEHDPLRRMFSAGRGSPGETEPPWTSTTGASSASSPATVFSTGTRYAECTHDTSRSALPPSERPASAASRSGRSQRASIHRTRPGASSSTGMGQYRLLGTTTCQPCPASHRVTPESMPVPPRISAR